MQNAILLILLSSLLGGEKGYQSEQTTADKIFNVVKWVFFFLGVVAFIGLIFYGVYAILQHIRWV